MSRIYDLVMTHKLDADDYFIQRVQWHCAARGLNFFLVEPLWVHEFLTHLDRGNLWARVLLNMHSEHHLPADIYHRLIWLAHSRNCQVIDPPDRALAAFDKAALHPRLVEAGLTVPPTVIVSREQAVGLKLTAEQVGQLGRPFIIKPALGYGKRGVIFDAHSEADLARSVASWPDGHYLLQRRIVPAELAGQPAYFRVFYVFGKIWCCWWNCFTDRYRVLHAAEEAAYALEPARAIVTQVAALTGMRFFSSELARTDAGEFVLIDYVNDQCHMLCQSANPQIGVPDEVVAGIAERLVEGALALMGRTP